MPARSIAAALAAGALIVTPNKRLARFVVAQHDDAQRRAGRAAWPAATALPWSAWLHRLWLEALEAGALDAPRPVVSPAQAAHLWERVVADLAGPLLDRRGAAAQAAEAWELFHAWREPGESVAGWARSGVADDAAAFARWALRYQATLDERALADAAPLADVLAAVAPAVPAWRGRRVALAGFVEPTPQQRRLLDALAAAGCVIEQVPPAAMPATTRCRVVCATPADELACALEWARERALADPQATIGIAVLDLARRRDEVLQQADDLLCPEAAVAVAADAARPYGLSFGAPLSATAPVAAALDLIGWPSAPLPMGEAAQLLRSPYLPGAEAAWRRRAGIEEAWRTGGLHAIGWNDAIAALLAVDRPLGERWQPLMPPPQGTRTPAQWVDAWRALLDAVGWPGDRALGSGEWQACEAWSRLLAEFATLAQVTPALPRDEALEALRRLAATTVFQPERPAARIQILGALEAAGMTFDALWIAGLAADAWPPPAQPNPLLPLAWQRSHGVPHADGESDLAWARALTVAFADAAREVVASHGRVVDGGARAGSALTRAWPERAVETLPQPRSYARTVADAGIALARVDDPCAPAIAPGADIHGGAGVVESQSACPFQAFARYRLGARAWPESGAGLTAMERGTLLHAALRALWSRLRDRSGLLALDAPALDEAIAAAVAAARAEISPKRWQSVPAAIASGEGDRLARTIRAWLDRCERERPPFAVRATELRLPLALAGLALTLQIDRVDTLEDGSVAIVDYKSGRTVGPAKWFAARPAGTQLGLYALALGAPLPAPAVRALAYARLKAGAIGVDGLAADGALWPGLPVPAAVRRANVPDWPAAEARFAATLGGLAEQFRRGEATVAPRDSAACRYCDLQPLCRISALDDKPAVAGDDDG